MEKPSVKDMMVAFSQDAVEHAKASAGVNLDYSLESIRQVEAILGELFDAMPRGLFGRLFQKGPSADDVSAVCQMYGGYLGEVVRRTGGGDWTLDTEGVAGEKTVCLRKGDKRVCPPALVRKRLTNGEADNVWLYFQALITDEWRS